MRIASGAPLFSFCEGWAATSSRWNLNPPPVPREGKLKGWKKIKRWPPVLPKEAGGYAHVFFSRFLKVYPFTIASGYGLAGK